MGGQRNNIIVLMEKTNESSESLMRIVVGLVSGIILSLWKVLVAVLVIVNLVITFTTNKRNKEIADFCEIWNTQIYIFLKYMTFVSNERPFPFEKMTKNISKVERGNRA
jgi:sorbitol-specific phosphotransferase system component IIC